MCYRYREMKIWPQRARLSADNTLFCAARHRGLSAIGIVKWNLAHCRQRLSADNTLICAWVPAGRNCYRYREMEIWPQQARLSADNGPICTWVPAGRNCYRYCEMEIWPWQAAIVGWQRGDLRQNSNRPELLQVLWNGNLTLTGSDYRLTTGWSAPKPQQAGTATGIAKWKSDPDRQRLSADNRGYLRQTPAGQNGYRYREMELWLWLNSIVGWQRGDLHQSIRWPELLQVSWNGNSAPTSSIVGWQRGICTRASAGPNCYRYREMEYWPRQAAIVGWQQGWSAPDPSRPELLQVSWNGICNWPRQAAIVGWQRGICTREPVGRNGYRYREMEIPP